MPVISFGAGYKIPVPGLTCPTPEEIANSGFTCTPYIASATGQTDPVFEPFTCFHISNPDCVEITVMTDGGTIVIPSTKPDTNVCAPEGCEFSSITLNTIPSSAISNVTVTVKGISIVPPDPNIPPLTCTYEAPQSDIDKILNPIGRNPCG